MDMLGKLEDICICQSKAATRHASDAVCIDMQTKARIWLFCSYLVSFGAVAGAGAVFISSVQHHKHVPMGVVSRAASHKPNACSYLSSTRQNLLWDIYVTLTNSNIFCDQGALLQAGFILAAALLLWAFRTPSDSTYYMMY